MSISSVIPTSEQLIRDLAHPVYDSRRDTDDIHRQQQQHRLPATETIDVDGDDAGWRTLLRLQLVCLSLELFGKRIRAAMKECNDCCKVPQEREGEVEEVKEAEVGGEFEECK